MRDTSYFQVTIVLGSQWLAKKKYMIFSDLILIVIAISLHFM